MFAPSPIVFRYGNNGLLAAAAAQAGFGQGAQAPRQTVQYQQNGSINDPIVIAGDGSRLQDAHSQMLSQQQGVSSTPQYVHGGSPLTDSIAAAKNVMRTAQLGGQQLSQQQSDQLDHLERDPNVRPEQYAQVLQHVTSGLGAQAKTASAQKEIDNKNAMLAAAKGQVHDEDSATLEQFANDPGISSNQFRMAIQQSSSHKAQAVAVQQQQQQKASLATQASPLLHPDDSQAIQSMVADPKVTTAQIHQAIVASHQHQVQAQQQQARLQVTKLKTQSANLRRDVAGFEKQYPGATANDFQGDAEGLKTFKQYQAKKQALEAVDNQIANIGGQFGITDDAQANNGLQQHSDDELLQQLSR